MDDPGKRRDLDINFHHTLLEVTKNPLLAKIGRAIYTLFFTSIEKTGELDPTSGYTNHQLVIDAIRRRDEDLARNVTRESLSFWRKIIDSWKLKWMTEPFGAYEGIAALLYRTPHRTFLITYIPWLVLWIRTCFQFVPQRACSCEPRIL
jgi:hypothetical protein